MTQWKYTCTECQKPFSRREHLQRHIFTAHGRGGRLQCPQCLKTLSRQDALARHVKTCRRHRSFVVEGTSDVDPPLVRQHLPLHQSQYPSTNPTTQLSRSYVNPRSKTKNSEPLFEEFHDTTIDANSGTLCKSLQVLVDPAIAFGFLISYTKDEGIVNRFGAKWTFKDHADLIQVNGHMDFPTFGTNSCQQTPQSTSALLAPDDFLQSWQDQYSDSQMFLVSDIAIYMTTQRCAEVLSRLKISNIANWTTDVEETCCKFWTPSRMLNFLDMFWEEWYPHWPVVHKPSFDISTVSVELLAAMTMVGACYSPNSQERLEAQSCFEIVEKMVFEHLEHIMTDEPIAKTQFKESLNALQAAYLVCLYLHWDGNRVRRYRAQTRNCDAVIRAARNLLVSASELSDLSELTASSFNWESFIQREELLRTIMWVFLIQCAFTIFHNATPRLAIRELDIGVVSPESCFRAQTASECWQNLDQWLCRTPSYRRPRSLHSLVISLCRKGIDESDVEWFAHQGFMNLWVIVAAFHLMIYAIEPALDLESQARPVQHGLDNWKLIWNRRTARGQEHFFDAHLEVEKPDVSSAQWAGDPAVLGQTMFASSGDREFAHQTQEWHRAGFWKKATEFWLLAQVMLDRLKTWRRSTIAAEGLSGSTGQHANMKPHLLANSTADETLADLHKFLRDFQTMQLRS